MGEGGRGWVGGLLGRGAGVGSAGGGGVGRGKGIVFVVADILPRWAQTTNEIQWNYSTT